MSVIHTIKKSDILRFFPGSSVNNRLEKVGILALLGLAWPSHQTLPTVALVVADLLFCRGLQLQEQLRFFT